MTKSNVTKTAIIADLKRVKRKAGSLTRMAYRKDGKFASSTVESKLGSWTKAKRV
jgi:hypothetical protein